MKSIRSFTVRDCLRLCTRQLPATAAVVVATMALMGQYRGVDHWWESKSGEQLPLSSTFTNATGELMIYNIDGPIVTQNHPFFEELGVNGRACVTCHQPANAMSLGTERLNERWVETKGKDPIFAGIDGSNCPSLPQNEKASHSLLLQRGLFRIYLPWPAVAAKGTPAEPEFSIEVVRDPTGCNTDPVYGLQSDHPTISVFRRPRMVGNLKYVVGSPDPLHTGSLAADGRDNNLELQAIDAAQAHEQMRRPLTKAEVNKILDFESQIFVAQTTDLKGGDLAEVDGPDALGAWNLGRGKVASDVSNKPVFFAADDWTNPLHRSDSATTAFRASVVRGNAIFSGRKFLIQQTANLTAKPQAEQAGTCATCHSSPMAGSNAEQRPMDVGTTNPAFTAHTLEVQDLPLFKITCRQGVPEHPFLGRVIYSTDPGRALITGKCADVGSIVAQQLRGLSARAPYFANGSAANLLEVVKFYDQRYTMKLTETEKQDLVNFLGVL
ncbi:hypothetical protein BH10ACI4_BH10ACI4_34420 [soil metagenome]